MPRPDLRSGVLVVFVASALGVPAPGQAPFAPELFPGGAHTEFALGAGSTIDLADFDGDGRLDLAGGGTNFVPLALGLGDATFALPVTSLLPGVVGSMWLEGADLDGDGARDLVGNGTFSELLMATALGQGDGTFASYQSIAVTTGEFRDAELADLDLDGEIDLLMATLKYSGTSPQQTTVLLGVGDGTFAAHALVASGMQPVDIEAEDFDRDGVPDFVVVDSWGPGQLLLFRGTGGAAFAPAGQLSAGAQPQRVAIGDWNSDGHADLAHVSGGTDEWLTTRHGDGMGGFSAPLQSELGMNSPQELGTLDIDLDGTDDVYMTDTEGGPTVLLCEGDGGFAPPAHYAGSSYSVELGDLDGDGDYEAVWTAAYTGVIGVFASIARGGPGGVLEMPLRVSVPAGTSGFEGIAIPFCADFDGDGDVDLAASELGLLTVYDGDGAGGLSPSASLGLGQGVNLCARGDVDGDGDLDLVMATGTGARPLVNDGAGQFSAASSIPAGAGIRPAVLEDLNGDGDPDLAVAAMSSYLISVSLGGASASFGDPVLVATGAPFRTLAAGDLDQDGAADLVAGVGLQFEGVHVFHANGDGTFAPSTLYPDPFAYDIAIADVDEDGDLDAAVAGTTTRLLPGDGAGGLGTPQILLSGSLQGLELADLDGDGHLDLAGETPFEHYTRLYRGYGGAPFSNPLAIPGGKVARAADFDGDGRLDLAMSGRDYLFSFPFIPYTSPYVCVSLNLAEQPLVTAIDGLAAAASGQVLVHGAGFEAASTVTVSGTPVPVSYVGPTTLALALGPAAPGLQDVVVTGTFGAASAPAGLARWPALSAGPGFVGAPLPIELANGGPGVYALAVSGGVLPAPLPIPGIYHGLELVSPFLLKVGAIPPPLTGTTHVASVPADPALQGVEIHLQGWAQFATVLDPPTSFTNDARVTLQ